MGSLHDRELRVSQTVRALIIIVNRGSRGQCDRFISLSLVGNPASVYFVCAHIYSPEGHSSLLRAINCCIINKFLKIFLSPLI